MLVGVSTLHFSFLTSHAKLCFTKIQGKLKTKAVLEICIELSRKLGFQFNSSWMVKCMVTFENSGMPGWLQCISYVLTWLVACLDASNLHCAYMQESQIW